MWVIACFLCAPAAHADWSFVMLGDTRGIGDTTATGVSLDLPAIAQEIAALKLKPDLVMVAGRPCQRQRCAGRLPSERAALD